jgi:hypothetical protein
MVCDVRLHRLTQDFAFFALVLDRLSWESVQPPRSSRCVGGGGPLVSWPWSWQAGMPAPRDGACAALAGLERFDRLIPVRRFALPLGYYVLALQAWAGMLWPFRPFRGTSKTTLAAPHVGAVNRGASEASGWKA